MLTRNLYHIIKVYLLIKMIDVMTEIKQNLEIFYKILKHTKLILQRSQMEPQKLPNVAYYGPCNLRIGENIIDNDRNITLKHGDTQSWCTCGLSKKQPFCDGSHKNTDFRSLKWKIPDNQKIQR